MLSQVPWGERPCVCCFPDASGLAWSFGKELGSILLVRVLEFAKTVLNRVASYSIPSGALGRFTGSSHHDF